MEHEFSAAIRGTPSKKVHNDCLACGYNIHHPLCPECLAKGFKQWIQQFPKDEANIRKKLDSFLHKAKEFDGTAKTCSACGKDRTHLCPYCFTEYLHSLVKEAGLGVRALSEFLFIFNFDFEHNGYSMELEAYGGY